MTLPSAIAVLVNVIYASVLNVEHLKHNTCLPNITILAFS